MDQNGKNLVHGQQTEWANAYDYCVQTWCVNKPEKSVFGYLEGSSWADFEGCAAEYDNSAELAVTRPSATCQSTCADLTDEDLKACLLECEELGVMDALVSISVFYIVHAYS